MPPRCTVCSHPQRAEIDAALVEGAQSNRIIANQFGVSYQAVQRHSVKHLPAGLVAAAEAEDRDRAAEVLAEIDRALSRVNKLYDACDAWLSDPDDPSRYDLSPRSHEVDIIHEVTDDNGRPRRRKERLSAILGRLEGAGVDVALVETRHADPRDLILKTSRTLEGHLTLLAKLVGELNEQPQLNLVVSPQWLEVRAALLQALGGHPEASQAVAGVLLELGDGS